MSPSNLGIVFGPSLMRPRPTGATISLSSLVDYPHQARIVETLIVFYSSIFQSKTSQSNKTSRSASASTQQVGLPVQSGIVSYKHILKENTLYSIFDFDLGLLQSSQTELTEQQSLQIFKKNCDSCPLSSFYFLHSLPMVCVLLCQSLPHPPGRVCSLVSLRLYVKQT